MFEGRKNMYIDKSLFSTHFKVNQIITLPEEIK